MLFLAIFALVFVFLHVLCFFFRRSNGKEVMDFAVKSKKEKVSSTISTMSTRTQGIIRTKLGLPGLPSKGLFHVEDRTTSRGYL